MRLLGGSDSESEISCYGISESATEKKLGTRVQLAVSVFGWALKFFEARPGWRGIDPARLRRSGGRAPAHAGGDWRPLRGERNRWSIARPRRMLPRPQRIGYAPSINT